MSNMKIVSLVDHELQQTRDATTRDLAEITRTVEQILITVANAIERIELIEERLDKVQGGLPLNGEGSS